MNEVVDRFIDALVNVGRSAQLISAWSLTLPDKQHAEFVQLCQSLPTSLCFCGYHNGIKDPKEQGE